MTAQSPNAFLLSAALHGLAAAVLMVLLYTANQDNRTGPKVFELVAGGGNNYAATEAPALGVPGGKKASSAQAVPNFNRSVQRIASRRAARLEAQYKKQLEAEERRRLSYEQFEKEQAAKSGAASAAPKGSRVDAEGIREGVIGGSTANTTGGAGGRALTREQGDLLEAYFALLKARVRENFVAPPDVSENLSARVIFQVAADGSISRVRIASSSGSPLFDQSVVDAFERTPSIGPRPDGRSDEAQCVFSLREEETP